MSEQKQIMNLFEDNEQMFYDYYADQLQSLCNDVAEQISQNEDFPISVRGIHVYHALTECLVFEDKDTENEIDTDHEFEKEADYTFINNAI